MPAPPLQLPTTALGAARMSRAKFAHSPSSLKPHDVTGWRVATQTPRADDPFGVRPGIRTLEPRTLEPRTLEPSNAVASAGAMLSIPPHNTTMGHMGMITPSLPLPRPHGGSDRLFGAKISCETKHTMQHLGVCRHGYNQQACQNLKIHQSSRTAKSAFFQQGPDRISQSIGACPELKTTCSVVFACVERRLYPPSSTLLSLGDACSIERACDIKGGVYYEWEVRCGDAPRRCADTKTDF